MDAFTPIERGKTHSRSPWSQMLHFQYYTNFFFPSSGLWDTMARSTDIDFLLWAIKRRVSVKPLALFGAFRLIDNGKIPSTATVDITTLYIIGHETSLIITENIVIFSSQKILSCLSRQEILSFYCHRKFCHLSPHFLIT